MLDMGFEPQIREVMQSLRKEHQTLLFSATMPEEIECLVDDHLQNAVRVKVGNIRPTANVAQHLEKTTDALKVGPPDVHTRKSIPYYRPPNNRRPPQIFPSSRNLKGKRREESRTGK